MPYKDPEKRKEYARLYRESNADKVAESNKRYYENNREAIREQQEEYREENCEEIRRTNRDYYDAHKEEINEFRKDYQRDYYQKNRDRLLAKSKDNSKKNRHRVTASLRRRRRELSDWLWSFKCGKSCECGENHPSCLDFHHLDPSLKENIVSKMVCMAASRDRILLEIEKCILICSNCHRKLHAKRPWPEL